MAANALPSSGAPAPASGPDVDADTVTKRHPVAAGIDEFGDLARFSVRAIVALPGSLRYFSEALRQLAIMLPGTLTLLIGLEFIMGLSGANFTYFLLKALGASDFTGIGGSLTQRTACVSMFGYVFVSKVCGGFVAEIGSMQINQEVDAFESTGVDPMKYVVGTRIIAALLFVPISLFFTLFGFWAGYYVTAVGILDGVDGTGLNQFFFGTQGMSDVAYVGASNILMVLATVFAACFYGMRARGGPAAVGDAVARAVLVNLVAISIAGLVIVTLWYGGNFGLPIGG
ncbi:MlaE family ABC transporter permease [Paraconexibacter sp.]|uniref:MlaE family ABC transporter permease n=1 Tax=Paraconexibacter sp. TaxID=2949640 RepID=UPI0035674C63